MYTEVIVLLLLNHPPPIYNEKEEFPNQAAASTHVYIKFFFFFFVYGLIFLRLDSCSLLSMISLVEHLLVCGVWSVETLVGSEVGTRVSR